MNDLISRQAVLDALEWKWAGKAAIDAIKNLPTVDPVKHGNWVGVDDEPHETFECDQCGYIYETYDGTIEWRYCPRCGARMEE